MRDYLEYYAAGSIYAARFHELLDAKPGHVHRAEAMRCKAEDHCIELGYTVEDIRQIERNVRAARRKMGTRA